MPGQRHMVKFNIHEYDGAWSMGEDKGDVLHHLDTGEHGLGIGTYTARSFSEERYNVGDFTITYEIRPAPLLTSRPFTRSPSTICRAAPGSASAWSSTTARPSPPTFEVALRVDGTCRPTGGPPRPALAPRMNYTACVETALPTPAPHRLAAVVDAPRAVLEFDETNNVYEQQHGVFDVSWLPTPATPPAPSQAKPDLTVSAIRVRGQVPDGKDDRKARTTCPSWSRTRAPARPGLPRPPRGGRRRWHGEEEVLADGLDAGKEHEVRFADVRLKEGERSLPAIADANKAIAETKDDNNELKVTARCKDDD